jgi:hypothetical protein
MTRTGPGEQADRDHDVQPEQHGADSVSSPGGLRRLTDQV